MFNTNFENSMMILELMSEYFEEFQQFVKDNETSEIAHYEFEDSWTSDDSSNGASAFYHEPDSIVPSKFTAKIEFSKKEGIFYMFVYKAGTYDLIFSVHLDSGMTDIKIVSSNLK